jgi:hypothetical protein
MANSQGEIGVGINAKATYPQSTSRLKRTRSRERCLELYLLDAGTDESQNTTLERYLNPLGELP